MDSEDEEPAYMNKVDANRLLRFTERFDYSEKPCEQADETPDSGADSDSDSSNSKDMWMCPVPSSLLDDFTTGDNLREQVPRKGITKDEEKLVKQLRKTFFDWYLAKDAKSREKLFTWGLDEASAYVVEAMQKGADSWGKVANAACDLLGLDSAKANQASMTWQGDVKVDDLVKDVLKKMPPSLGMALRRTVLDDDQLQNLVNFEDTYTISEFPGAHEDQDEGSMILSASLGADADAAVTFAARPFMFVINSRSGRFLPMVSNEAVQHEIDFADWIGKGFKLLGYDRLYGYRKDQWYYREESADDSDQAYEGHYAVFWFDEITPDDDMKPLDLAKLKARVG
ncbi:Uu.00g083420.m01.CDS01 [Anthostomella pinea]|uniref:Uu.00g083420.m01.CDS01 n=1 Tax=Anthostomella pinea TaxID=933095 RepID=A0AAI8YJH4_9PEZI|nr:Uu.00g083420.m01.CDS01 [Anthostomella pinea]